MSPEWFEAAAKVLEAIAWPVAFLISLVIARRYIPDFLDVVEHIKLGDKIELKIRRRLRDAREKADENLPLSDETVAAIVAVPPDKEFLELAKNYPEAAIMECWIRLENTMTSAARHLGFRGHPMISQVHKYLWEKEGFPKDMEGLFQDLREIRNQVAHGRKADLGLGEVLEYKNITDLLIRVVHENVKGYLPGGKP